MGRKISTIMLFDNQILETFYFLLAKSFQISKTALHVQVLTSIIITLVYLVMINKAVTWILMNV
jgi:hypothetical protein